MTTLLNHLDKRPHENGELVLVVRTDSVEIQARRLDAKRYRITMRQLGADGLPGFARAELLAGDPEGTRLVVKELLADAKRRPIVDTTTTADPMRPDRARPGAGIRRGFEVDEQRRAAERKG